MKRKRQLGWYKILPKRQRYEINIKSVTHFLDTVNCVKKTENIPIYMHKKCTVKAYILLDNG